MEPTIKKAEEDYGKEEKKHETMIKKVGEENTKK